MEPPELRFLGSGHGNLENPRGFGQRSTVIIGKGAETGIRSIMGDRNQCASMKRQDSSRPGKGIIGAGKRADNISDAVCFLQRKAVVLRTSG
jgi:hypothetical protein